MKTINKDITTVESGIIVHQVNCQGAMGSGVAKALYSKYPKIKEEYLNYYNDHKSFDERVGTIHNVTLLGKINPVKINENLTVINFFGQECYGYDGKRYTSYAAWEIALPKIKKLAGDQQVYFPYLCGCALGGGNWEIISRMIEEVIPNVIFCKV